MHKATTSFRIYRPTGSEPLAPEDPSLTPLLDAASKPKDHVPLDGARNSRAADMVSGRSYTLSNCRCGMDTPRNCRPTHRAGVVRLRSN